MANLGNLLVTGSARFLNKIKGTVENADKLGGASPSESATGSTIVKRHSSGYIYGTYFNSNISNEDINSYTNDPAIMFTSNDKWMRRTGKTNFQTWLGFNGTTFYSGNKDNSEHNANNAIKNGNYYYSSNGPATSLGASTNDGALFVQAHSDPWVAQIAQDYRNGGLYVRGKNNGTWQSWYKVWDSRNLSSKAAAASGTDLSLVTTGEKATWNAKGSGTVTQVKVGSTAYNPSSGVISLPAYPTDTNNAVTQTDTTTNASYRVLFSSTADDTTRTEGARKSTTLTFNPSNGTLDTPNIIANESLIANDSYIENDSIRLGSIDASKGYIIAGNVSSGYYFAFGKTDTLISSTGSFSAEDGGNFTILPNISASYFQLADGALYFVNIRVFSNSTPKGQLLGVYNRIITAAHFHSSVPFIGSFADAPSSTPLSTYMSSFTGYNGNQIRFSTASGNYAGIYISFIRLN